MVRVLILSVICAILFLQLTGNTKAKKSFTATVVDGNPGYSDKTIKMCIPKKGVNKGKFIVEVKNTGDEAIILQTLMTDLRPATGFVTLTADAFDGVILPGESKKVSFTAEVYPGATEGTYTAIMQVTASDLTVTVDPYIITYKCADSKDGGVNVPVDKLALSAPYVGVASAILVATVAAASYIERVKHRKEK